MAKKRASRSHETIETLNITKGAGGKRISRPMYEATRDAILKLLPVSGDGMLFTDLMKQVGRHVPRDLFEGASVPWYTATVKLDLEARGLIERVPRSHPQRLRRVKR